MRWLPKKPPTSTVDTRIAAIYPQGAVQRDNKKEVNIQEKKT